MPRRKKKNVPPSIVPVRSKSDRERRAWSAPSLLRAAQTAALFCPVDSTLPVSAHAALSSCIAASSASISILRRVSSAPSPCLSASQKKTRATVALFTLSARQLRRIPLPLRRPRLPRRRFPPLHLRVPAAPAKPSTTSSRSSERARPPSRPSLALPVTIEGVNHCAPTPILGLTFPVSAI